MSSSSTTVNVTRSYLHQIASVLRAANKLNETTTLKNMIDITLNTLKHDFNLDSASFAYVENDSLSFLKVDDVTAPIGVSIPLSRKTVTTRAANTGVTQRVEDVRLDPDYTFLASDSGSRSELAVPILVHRKVRALINVEDKTVGRFTAEDQNLVELLADSVSSALKRLEQENIVEALHQSALNMNSINTIEELASATFQTIHNILGFDYGSLAIIEGENLVHRYHFGWNTEIMSMPLHGQGITVNAAVTGESQLVNDVRLDPDYIYSTQEERARTIISELAVPVKTRGTVLAVINIESKTDHAFSEKHKVLLEILAHHISSAIERIRTQEQESTRKQRQFDSILENIERHSRGVRHDLRSPLQSITNATYLMMKRPEQAKTYYQMVADSMSYCDEILADLWTNVKTSNLSLGKIEFDQLLDLSLIGVSGLERVQVVRDNVSNVTITLDKAKIRRVLHNLLQNAVDAMPDSGVITVTNDVSLSGLEIIIQDTGQGIKKQVMTEIFTPFFTTKPNGMGLGLNLCKQVVEAHGGSIHLESEEGKGCRAHVHLPISTVDNSSTSLPLINYPKTK